MVRNLGVNGAALKLTTAYYYTPREKLLSGVGIEPDIQISLSDEDYKALRQQLPDDRMVVTSGAASTDEPEVKVDDVQLKEAFTVLRGYMLIASQEKPEEEPQPTSPEEVM
jgi:C-terminal processing protease CtpA/Prc